MEKRLILSQIQTPDGTILKSMHVHDYVTHVDKNGLIYMLDGGSEYQRYNLQPPGFEHKDLSIYSDSPFEIIRENFYRGGRGKDGKQPLTFTPICEMNDAWLQAAIAYNTDYGMGTSVMNRIYAREQEYRKQNNITIDDIN